ncbi:HAMP domain-containing sensor histidine kinase [Flavobacterium sp. ASW18X]|uniref:sensor histidine kinase n=1 Tax=Flavobacterium sp. ASW18X TaxID=2572595 RepID=UPI0010AE85A4|nr:HAMP domain-containing sensor histidine kinase [Flavobacterium sp. ASW18X]TKD65958.1 HAMP domain-containing protein [Flavobacterium sp. ASW18X]
MNTIRGRILLAFLTLCLITAPVILFTYNSMKDIETARNLKEQVAFFNINRLKAVNTFNILIEEDPKLDAFYTTDSTANLLSYKNYMQNARIALEAINTTSIVTSQVVDLRVEDITNKLHSLDNYVNEIIRLKRERGFKDYGLEGEMRKHIRSLENDTTTLTQIENLSLRRKEKDYFLRSDLSYANALNQMGDSILLRLAKDIETNKKSITVLEAYLTNFNKIVQLESAIGDANTGLLFQTKELNQLLNANITKLYDVLNEDLELLINKIKSFIILFLLITFLFLIVFAFVFSGYIVKPIKQLITDMDHIVENDFKLGTKVTVNTNSEELDKLSKTYDNLVQKIQNQITHLNLKNEELNSLNSLLAESEVELKEASKIKDKFFSIVSHDLKGHTGNVLSLAQVIDQNKGLSEAEKSVFTKYLLDSTQNLQLLLDNLLNWAKTQMSDHEISKRSFDLHKVIQKNIELFQDGAYRKGVELIYLPTEVHKAYADKDMVDFILRNLMSNALKYTTQGDRIAVTVHNKEEQLYIKVSDTGVGMTTSQVQALLNSNQEGLTTKGTHNEEGNGLGFSICVDFIKRNGGTLEIDSEQGKGSAFIFSLPTNLTTNAILNKID